jgi:hypothetical protein
MSGWNILFHAFALVAALLGLLFPEFHLPLIGGDGEICATQAQIAPSLGLLFAPMMVRLSRHTRKFSPLEYALLGLAITPFTLGILLGDCLSLRASLVGRNTALILILLALVCLVAVALRLGSDDACRLPARRRGK